MGAAVIEGVADAVEGELPRGWEVVALESDDELRLECQHVVLGGHVFHWSRDEAGAPDELVTEVIDRLTELGLVEATRRMPPLTVVETESLREAHAVVSTADVSRAQARNIVGLTHLLRQVSQDAADWAVEALDLVAEWHGLPPDRDADDRA